MKKLLFLILLSVYSYAYGISLALKDGAKFGKYGLVIAHNKDGTFNREYKITAKELKDLQSSTNGIPPGLSKGEWESGLAVVAGKDFDVGDMKKDLDDRVTLKYSEKLIDGKFEESFTTFRSTEWSGVYPGISVDSSTIKNPALMSIQNGILEFTP